MTLLIQESHGIGKNREFDPIEFRILLKLFKVHREPRRRLRRTLWIPGI